MRRSVWNCAATAACSLKVENDRTGLTDNNVVDGVDDAIDMNHLRATRQTQRSFVPFSCDHLEGQTTEARKM